MAEEHQELHQVVTPAQRKPSFFDNALFVIAGLGVCSQCVLLGKVILIDHDLAISGFSLFFLAIFGIAYLISLKRAALKLMRWVGIALPIVTAAVIFVVFLALQRPMAEWFASAIIAFALSFVVTAPSFLCSRCKSNEK